ncbi:MAG: hypothetical protein LBS53_02070, partial [Synergistaceae bacterium]|nr:hypothetical protein [Synergistaceae bacterium]
MAYYLIDYENVHQSGLDGMGSLSADDSIVVFFGNKTPNVPMEVLHGLVNTRAVVSLKNLKKTANNYLDFQLATHLGAAIAGNPDVKEYYIISKDKDYEAVIDYWKARDRGVSVAIFASVSAARKPRQPITPAPEPPEPQAPPEETTLPASASKDKVNAAAVKDFTAADKNKVKAAVKDLQLSLPVNAYKSIYAAYSRCPRSADFHNELVKICKAMDKAQRL